jgi:hypothetical protein
MKRFKLEGWYRYNDEKDFEQSCFNVINVEEAIERFKRKYSNFNFYKIDIKEIV